jgi:hypothetical protein
MNTNYDGGLIYQFLTQTPEGALKKMLVDKAFTDVHFAVLMKVVRNSDEVKFCDHFYNSTFPKAKFNANEINLKEKFWGDCINTLNQHGLLSPAQKAAA